MGKQTNRARIFSTALICAVYIIIIWTAINIEDGSEELLKGSSRNGTRNRQATSIVFYDSSRRRSLYYGLISRLLTMFWSVDCQTGGFIINSGIGTAILVPTEKYVRTYRSGDEDKLTSHHITSHHISTRGTPTSICYISIRDDIHTCSCLVRSSSIQ